MAVITPTNVTSTTPVALTKTTLGASDTFAYTQGKTRYLILDNVTAGALTPKVDGDGATTKYLQGVGSITISDGYTFASIGAGATVIVDLDNISAYLKGTITVTGGDGIEAAIVEV